MKVLWRVAKEAKSYRGLLLIAIFATLALTGVNLYAPQLLSQMTGIVSQGVDEAALQAIGGLAVGLLGLYLSRILLRYLSNYMAHKAAWNLVQEIRLRAGCTTPSNPSPWAISAAPRPAS